MDYITKLKEISQGANLTKTEEIILENFTDNYIGSADEGYIPNKEYYERHKKELKSIMRKLKEHEVYGQYLTLCKPLQNKGFLNLL